MKWIKEKWSDNNFLKWALPVGALLLNIPSGQASIAQFSLNAKYIRNKEIWGTYKLDQEKLNITRGKKHWSKKPTSRVGDVIITDGNIVFIRETKEEGQTKIVVDKIPYKKIGKSKFVNKDPLDKEVMDRLYRPDLKAIVPHQDLLDGTIQYNELECIKKKKNLSCALNGQLLPST